MRSALWLLTFVNLFNYLDRYIIASAAAKIEAEFGLSHVQTGFIMSAFMVGYMITSPIFGWLADRQARPKLMGMGVFVWSIATAFTGWAGSFLTLILSRIGVGVGEASYATITPSYIRDLVKDERKVNKAISLFYTAIPVGAALGYMWGGYISEHYDWRWAFYLGALPGLVLGFFVYFMSEPARTTSTTLSTSLSVTESLNSLWKNRLYRLTVFGYTAHTFALGGFAAWGPHYSSHHLSVSLSEASFKIGAVTCLAGVIGTLIGGKWGDRFIKGTEAGGDASVKGFNLFCALASLLATPFAFWLMKAHTMNEFMIAMFAVQVFMFAAVSPINTATLASVRPEIAATAFAAQIFVIHALGDLISPPLVGWLADRMPMSDAMMVLVVALAVSAIVWWVTGRAKLDAAPSAA